MTDPRAAATPAYAWWMDAADVEYRRIIDLLGRLDHDDWQRATACDDWDVRAVVAHLLGAAEAMASPRENLHQFRVAMGRRPRGRLLIDAINEVQVRERSHLTPLALVEALDKAGSQSVAARRRVPAPVRAVRLPLGQPLGLSALGRLLGRTYVRDAWMHRIDLARATGAPIELTADHDGGIVADVVGEWTARHRQPVELALGGAAGGTWSTGQQAALLSMDAVEFCRVLSGRGSGQGLMAVQVPF